MKTKKILTLLFILPFLGFSANITLTSLTSSNLSSINSGDVVTITTGTYTINQTIVDAWANGVKNNVTFKSDGGLVIIKGTLRAQGQGPSIDSGDRAQNQMRIQGWSNLLIKDITFENIEIWLENNTNSTLDNLVFTGQLLDGSDIEKKDYYFCVQVRDGSNCTVKNCTIDWTYTDPNNNSAGEGIKVIAGKSHKFLNNHIKGFLKNAMTMQSNKKTTSTADPVTNHLIQGGIMETSLSDPELAILEDHGLYVFNISDVTVDGVTFRNWTDTAGGQLKLKGVKRVEIKNSIFYRSGIMIRVATNWMGVNDHIWIHDNIFEQGGIGSYASSSEGSVTINNSAVIENNLIKEGTIGMSRENSTKFNAYNDLAGKNGGVFNNCTKTNISLLSGITNSGNTDIASCGLGTSNSDTTVDTPPSAIQTTTKTQSSITISWTTAADATGIQRHEVSKDNGANYIAINTGTTHQFTGLTQNTNYTIKVRAVDNTNNTSTDTSAVIKTKADTSVDTAPSAIQVSGKTENSITISWTAASDISGIQRHEVSKDNGATYIAVNSGTTYQFTGLIGNTDYTIKVRALDNINNISTDASSIIKTSPDASVDTPPSAIQTSTKTDNSITISWTAGADTAGIQRHEVSKDNGANYIAVNSGLTHQFTGLTPDTEYTIKVRAIDNSNNTSSDTSTIIRTNIYNNGGVTTQNIALNQSIINKSGEQAVTGNLNYAINIVDGKEDDINRWSSINGSDGTPFNEFVIIDLGINKTITGTEVIPFNGRTYQFVIHASNTLSDIDDVNINNISNNFRIVDQTTNTIIRASGTPITNSITNKSARYVRLTVTGLYYPSTYTGYKSSWVSINEFKVMGHNSTNLAADNISLQQVNLTPNPFAYALTVNLSETESDTQIYLINIKGQVIYSKVANAGEIVKLTPSYSIAPSGIYLIKLVNKSASKSYKIIRK